MTRKKLIWQVPFLLFLIVGSLLIVLHQRSMPYRHDQGRVFGTVYHITYQADRDLHEAITAELRKVDDALSTFNRHSIIARINRNERVRTNEMFDDVFRLAQEIARETDGSFDITVAPLVNLWGFGFKTIRHPAANKVDSIRRFVGFRKVRLQNGHVVKDDPRLMLDCSAIAKGYGADAIARLLQRNDVRNYMVEIGGEIVVSGNSERRVPWKIGVSKPIDDPTSIHQEMMTVLNITNRAMATSGNYRNFYYKGGRKYAHTIDPATGFPVQHSLLSATVLAHDCATADAYATAFMVMGIDRARELLSRHPELKAYLIYQGRNGELKTWESPSLKP